MNVSEKAFLLTRPPWTGIVIELSASWYRIPSFGKGFWGERNIMASWPSVEHYIGIGAGI